jgi:hypothetical protein
MARKSSAGDPALAIEFWLSGFYTHRSQLFAPFKGIGVNVVSFHDPVIDGQNMEDTDLFEWTRRPGFSIFCPTPLSDGEIVNQFYDMRNLNGQVFSFFDSNIQLASFTNAGYTQIIDKTSPDQGFICAVGSMMYFSDGAAADMQKWLSTQPFSPINPSAWGIPAPTLTPSIYNHGCWLPDVNFVLLNAILDPNGSVEVVTMTYGGSGISGNNEPIWPTTKSSTVNDGSIQWTNEGPLETWLPATYFPVPVVVLDTNGNLQLATATSPEVIAWNPATVYAVGITVSFAGLYWTSLVAGNTGVAPNANYTVTTGGTTQPYWVEAQNPSQTGIYPTSPYTPTWNKTVGGTTTDGNYTWTNLGPGNLVESFGTSYVYAYRTIYGHLSTSSPVSINTGSIFGPVIATITGFSISGNVVTFLGVNNFVPGNVFTVQGLSIGTYLNNQPFIVISAGLTPNQFEAAFVYPDVGPTVDSGSTLNLIATISGVGNSSPLCNAAVSITGTEILDGVVTVYAVNQFVPGLQVTFSGVSVATFLNGQQFEIINADPLGQWFQVYYTTSLGVVPPNQPETTDTGTATFNAVEIYRVSDGGGIYLFVGAVSNPTAAIFTPFDSGVITTTQGTDDGVPGTYPWTNPNNVTSDLLYATVTIPAPTGSGTTRFNMVQSTGAITGEPSTPLTLSSAFAHNVTSGNTILLYLMTYDVATFSVRDSMGNVYTQIAQVALPDDGGVVTMTIYRAQNVSGGPTTVTATITNLSSHNNVSYGFLAYELAGLTGVIDVQASNSRSTNTGGGTTFNTGTVTTGNADDVLFTFLYNDMLASSSNVATAPAGYTVPLGYANYDNGVNEQRWQQIVAAYQVRSATGVVSPTWGTPSQSQQLGVTLALKLVQFAPSDGLDAEKFNFAVPPSVEITGITIQLDASFTGNSTYGSLDVQLLRGGNPVGQIVTIHPTAASTNYTLGGAGDLWGVAWSSANFNNPAWGVRIIASQAEGGTNGTFSVRNVRAELTGGSSTTNWTYYDFVPDQNLDILQIAPQNHLNDPPPGAPGSSVNQVVGTLTTYWNGRIWMVVGNYVYFTAGSDCTNGVPEESWPPANRFQFAGPVFGISKTADGVGLLVFLADRVNAILGGPETISFYPTDALDNFGISNVNAVFRDGSTIGLFTTQKQYFELIESRKEEIGEHVADYLNANFAADSTYVTMHRDGEDVGMFLSNGNDQVLRYGTNISAWSVPAFPLGGAGALRSVETSIGIHTLMLASPVASQSGSSPLVFPDSGVNIGFTSPIRQQVFSPNNTLIFTTPVQTGSTVVLFCAGSSSVSSITDNLGNVYQRQAHLPPPGPYSAGLYVAQNVTGGSIIIAAAPPLSVCNMYAMEIPSAYGLDGLGGGDASNTNTLSGTVTATTNYDMILGVAFWPQSATVGSGLTVDSEAIVSYVGPFAINGVNGGFNVSYKFSTDLTPTTFTWHGTIYSGAIPLGLVLGIKLRPTAVPWVDASNITLGDPSQYATATLTGGGNGGIDQQALATGYSDSISVGPVTPSLTDEWALLVATAGLLADSANPTFTPASGWTTFASGSGIGQILGQYLPTAAPITGNITMTTTPYTASSWAASLVTFALANPPTLPTIVQTSGSTTGPNNGTVLNFTNPVTAGNSIIFFLLGEVDSSTSGSTFTMSDTIGNVFTVVADEQVAAQGSAPYGCRLGVAIAQQIFAGADAVTIHATWANGTIGGYAVAMEVAGLGVFTGPTQTQILAASAFPITIPANAIVSGVQVKVTGYQVNTGTDPTPVNFTITPLGAVAGAESDTGHFGSSNTTLTFGSSTDLWGMPWLLPSAINSPGFGFGIQITDGSNVTMNISEVQVQVFYQQPSSYIRGRDINSWGDTGQYGKNNGIPYSSCYITVGSITLSQPGAPLFPLQHIVGYFDGVGMLQNGGPSYPDIWILPNEVNDDAGTGFVYLPPSGITQEPPVGQNQPSESLLALRWNLTMMNSNLTSQYIHHLQVKIQFEPENAPNTIKAIAFKENQED